MKLVTVTHVSVDGVIQGLGGRSEDPRGGFERGGWALPLFSDEGADYVSGLFQRADAFLLGRRTYEIFAPYWGAMGPGSGPIADSLNQKPKYVVSDSLENPDWSGTTVLSGDVAAAVRELRSNGAGELQVHGSGVLVRWLLANGLVDELTLITFPVVVGQGTRLFPEAGPDMALELVESQAFPIGTSVQVYRPSGRPTYAPAAP